MLEQQELTQSSIIAEAVSIAVQRYLNALGEGTVTNVYDLVIEQVDVALLHTVMPYFHNNQVRAAKALGLSRGTLRKKLRQYFDDQYCGERKE